MCVTAFETVTAIIITVLQILSLIHHTDNYQRVVFASATLILVGLHIYALRQLLRQQGEWPGVICSVKLIWAHCIALSSVCVFSLVATVLINMSEGDRSQPSDVRLSIAG